MKPSWKDAPEWAQWLALDGDGYWKWFENKPEFSEYSETWFDSYGQSKIVIKIDASDTLEPRP